MPTAHIKNSYKFPALPFVWHPLAHYQENEFPEVLPFELILNEKNGILYQKANTKIIEILESSYKRGTYIEGLMNETGIGRTYADDFLKFIDQVVGLKEVASKTILEIGCGTGYLLHRLKLLGAEVLGFEPGYRSLGKYPLSVIEKFFPSSEIKAKKFDIIIAYGVLEHVSTPGILLKNFAKYLKDTGILIISVPNCEDQIQNGDISMLIHEHFPYFTASSLQSLLESQGYSTVVVRKADFGGSIYGAFKKSKSSSLRYGHVSTEALGIFEKIDLTLSRMKTFLTAHRNQRVGIYGPLRALNTLYLFKDLIEESNILLRFFDDSEYLNGKYFPGFNIAIENRDALFKDPCDIVLIYSYTFAQQIYEKLKGYLPETCKLIGLAELKKIP